MPGLSPHEACTCPVLVSKPVEPVDPVTAAQEGEPLIPALGEHPSALVGLRRSLRPQSVPVLPLVSGQVPVQTP